MKARFIHPRIWNSPKFLRMHRDARLLWIGLFSTADDYGKGRADLIALKAQFFPVDDDVKLDQIQVHLAEIQAQGMVNLYQVSGESFYQVAKWNEYQHFKYYSKSYLPDCPQIGTKLVPSCPQSGTESEADIDIDVDVGIDVENPSSPLSGDGVSSASPDTNETDERDAAGFQEHMDYFNAEVAPKLPGCPKIEKLTKLRRKHLRQRLEEHPDLWTRVLAEIPNLGQFAHDKRFINFDFLMGPQRLQKFLEGFYRRRDVTYGQTTQAATTSRESMESTPKDHQ